MKRTILFLPIALIILSCQSQFKKCKTNKNIKREIVEVFKAEKSNNKVLLTDSFPISNVVRNYADNENITTVDATYIYDNGQEKERTEYNYKNNLLQSYITTVDFLNGYDEDHKIEVFVTTTNSTGQPILLTDKDSLFTIEYTYENCLEKTKTVKSLEDGTNKEGRILSYNEKGDVQVSLTLMNIEEESYRLTANYYDYQYNEKKDWISRVVEESDGSIYMEIRSISYYQ